MNYNLGFIDAPPANEQISLLIGEVTVRNNVQKSLRHAKARTVIGKTISDGRERWSVTWDGEQRTLTTSDTTVKAMDQAMDLFGPALKRLANR